MRVGRVGWDGWSLVGMIEMTDPDWGSLPFRRAGTKYG